MGDSGVVDNEILGQYHWEHILDELPNDLSFFDDFLVSDLSNPASDSVPLTMDDIDQILLGDDDNKEAPGDTVVAEQQLDVLSNYLLDSPIESDRSAEVVDLTDGGKNANSPYSSEEDNRGVSPPQDNSGDYEDPTDKKRQRQLRNRDAAVRSRERKKMYVRDLEMKTKYLEGECRRLGMLLQCCCAENQALRLSLQNAKASDASMTKQESAVLLLESLLLGSLLWFLGIICLLIQPGLVQFDLEAVQKGSVDKKNQRSLAVRKQESRVFGLHQIRSFMVSKRCKASRSRMKPSPFLLKFWCDS